MGLPKFQVLFLLASAFLIAALVLFIRHSIVFALVSTAVSGIALVKALEEREKTRKKVTYDLYVKMHEKK